MDFEIILFIIIGVISLISRIVAEGKKKKKAPPQRNVPPGKSAPGQEKKPFSFEDLLKEFEKEMTGEQTPEPEPEPEPVRTMEERTPQEYTPVPKRKSKYEQYQTTNYDEAVESSGSPVFKKIHYERDDNYAIDNDKSNTYRNLLSSKKGLKNAIVLNEILKRKY